MVRVRSKKPSKQRNALRNIKNHQVSKLFTVGLDENLQAEYGIKRLPVRKNDSVRIISGQFEGIEGKVLDIFKKSRKVTIEEATLQKRDSSNYFVPIPISKIVLTKFGEKKMDPWREKMIDRKEKLEIAESISPKKAKSKKGGK
ncbi:MAG: 50S ribosomal protein L24 [Promethearchaeota archaeon]